jgi:flagellar hook-basal body complex protein FliE
VTTMAAIGPIPAIGGIDRLATASGPAPIGLASPADPLATGGITSTGVGGVAPTSGAGAPAGPAQSFLDTLGDSFGQLNQQLVTADLSLADFAAGGSSDLHTVMLQMQEASLGLKLGVQVRDKFLEAYQEIMRLQV